MAIVLKGQKGKVVNCCREEVVNSISKEAATFIMRKAIEEAPSVEDAIDCAHDVVRHLAKKLNVEV